MTPVLLTLYNKSKNNQEIPMTSLNFQQLKIKHHAEKNSSTKVVASTFSGRHTNILENPQS